MLNKVEDIIIYKDEPFYSAFPSAVTLADGTVLVSFRRAPEPRWLLGTNAPENLRNWISHVHERSHHAMLRLDGKTLKPLGPAVALPMNPLAADQDGSLLLTRRGRLIIAAFSWYGFQPVFVEQARAYSLPLHGGPEHDGLYYAFFGGFTRYTDDGGRTWSDHNYLPPLPGAGDFIPGKRPRYGGAIRGRAVEADGEILLPVY
ncbi:MAG: exo-alpha-sialidase, partial [Planctomycetes bacterium]|nr:exo-alpha-sialidase [Planctomycetota bacterium]